MTQLAPVVETNVGLEGVYYARVRGPALAAKPVDDSAPVVLRMADAVQDGEATIYELRFVGSLPGRYDLRDYLVRVDGQPPSGVEPMQVAVHGLLPDDHDGSLESLARPAARTPLAYRALLALVAALWLLPPAWLLVRRWTRPRVKPHVVENGRPSLADQLRPLVEAAVAGRVTATEQARLERLLIAHWRQRLDLNGCPAVDALREMRRHPEAGELLRELDKWLHQPPGTARVDVAAILLPYRDAAPMGNAEVGMRKTDCRVTS